MTVLLVLSVALAAPPDGFAPGAGKSIAAVQLVQELRSFDEIDLMIDQYRVYGNGALSMKRGYASTGCTTEESLTHTGGAD